jgi:hypothetical protein
VTDARAYTAEEVRDFVLGHIGDLVHYWDRVPDRDEITGREHTQYDRLHGLAFSILNIFDGTTMALPAFTITADPHPDDKQYRIDEGSNWFEPGTDITDGVMLHEAFCSSD